MAITVQPDYKLGSDMAMNIAMNHPQTDAVSFALGRDIKKAAEEDDEKAFLSNIAKKHSSYSINPDTGEKEFKLDRQGMINDAWKYGYADQARKLEKDQEPELKKKIWSELFTRYSDPNTGEITDRPAFLKGVHSIGDPEISSKTMEFFQKKDDEKNKKNSVEAYIIDMWKNDPLDPKLTEFKRLYDAKQYDDIIDYMNKKVAADQNENQYNLSLDERLKLYDVKKQNQLDLIAARNKADIEKQRELTPILTERAGKTAEERNKALKPLEPDVVNDFSRERKQTYLFKDALSKFKDEFATPYLGGAFNNLTRKQLDDKYSKFRTTISLAVNDYVNKNFGSAMTQAELERANNVINNGLNVSPDVLVSQVNTMIDVLEKGYYDKLKTYEQNSRIIPENLKDINYKETKGTTTNVPSKSASADEWLKWVKSVKDTKK